MAELLIGLFILWFLIAWPLWGIFDAATRPDDVWQEVHQNKILWVVLQIVLWTLGTIAYFASVRPKLRTIEAQRAWDEANPGASTDVSYTLSDWNPTQLDRLARGLVSAGIDHRWEGVKLVVQQGDDAEVDRMLDAIEEGTYEES